MSASTPHRIITVHVPSTRHEGAKHFSARSSSPLRTLLFRSPCQFTSPTPRLRCYFLFPLPNIYPDSKFTSFQRQLNLYQFKRRKGAHAGAFHHPCFRRGQRHLLAKVRRQKVKRDLAVEARAAQRLARSAREAGSHYGSSQKSPDLPSRGRTRTASQADLRTVKTDPSGVGDDLSAADYKPGSRRSALRRRVDPGPASADPSVPDSSIQKQLGGPQHDDWSKDGALGVSHMPEAGRGWGEQWRHHRVTASPERTPRMLYDPSTPSSLAQSSEYTASSPSGSTTSDGSSSSSSLSNASFSTPLPHDCNAIFHSSGSSISSLNSSNFDDEIHDNIDSNDDDNCISPSSRDISPLSHHPHTPVEAAVAAVQQAAAAQVTPCDDNALSLVAAVDAHSPWPQQQQRKQQTRPFEPFHWGRPGGEADTAPVQPPGHEDFGFIDLFAENWDATGEDTTADTAVSHTAADAAPLTPASPIGMDDGKMEAFMKEAEAAGVFGVEEFFLPRAEGAGPGPATGGSAYGPAAFA